MTVKKAVQRVMTQALRIENFRSNMAASRFQSVRTESSVTPKDGQPYSLSDSRDERANGAWYDDYEYSSDRGEQR